MLLAKNPGDDKTIFINVFYWLFAIPHIIWNFDVLWYSEYIGTHHISRVLGIKCYHREAYSKMFGLAYKIFIDKLLHVSKRIVLKMLREINYFWYYNKCQYEWFIIFCWCTGNCFSLGCSFYVMSLCGDTFCR